MNRSPLYSPVGRAGEFDGGGAADLQTDIMRFMAILSLCLVAIFALVQSLPLMPATSETRPVALPVAAPAGLPARPDQSAGVQASLAPASAGSSARPEPQAVVATPTRAATRTVPAQRESVKPVQAPQAPLMPDPPVSSVPPPPAAAPAGSRADAPQDILATASDAQANTAPDEPAMETVEAVMTPSPPAAPVRAEAAPPADAAPAETGFSLRFESDTALTRLVARDAVGLYAIAPERALRMSVNRGSYVFWPASLPNEFHEMDPGTVPRTVVAALQRSGALGLDPAVKWGVTLPAKLRRQLDTYLAGQGSGALVIDGDGALRLER